MRTTPILISVGCKIDIVLNLIQRIALESQLMKNDCPANRQGNRECCIDFEVGNQIERVVRGKYSPHKQRKSYGQKG